MFPLGFSFTSMFDNRSAGCVTGLIVPLLQSLDNSSLTLSSLDTGMRRLGAWTGVTLGSISMCRGFPRGFLHPASKIFAYCWRTFCWLIDPSARCDGWFFTTLSATWASSAKIFKNCRACTSLPLRRGVFPEEHPPRGNLECEIFLSFHNTELLVPLGAVFDSHTC